MSKGVQVAGGATLIALILGWYAATNLDGGIAFTYYETLDSFLLSPVATNGESARVHGYVALDSIERHFGPIPRPETPMEQAPTVEPATLANVCFSASGRCLSRPLCST